MIKIAAVQFEPKFKDIDYNFEKIISLINSVDADLICFPELSTTGYFFLSKEEIAPFVLNCKDEKICEIQNLATRLNKIIIFGFAEIDGHDYFNSAAVLFPNKKKSKVYRKTHLFYKEAFVFSPGNTGFFVEHFEPFDLKIGTMICYDWRFPEAARTLALLGADLIVCPSNLVTKIWTKAMPTRALENKVYLLVANRIGSETNGTETLVFNGQSGIWDYDGNLISSAGVDEETILVAEIFPEQTRNKSFNQFNDIFLDRRPSLYKLD